MLYSTIYCLSLTAVPSLFQLWKHQSTKPRTNIVCASSGSIKWLVYRVANISEIALDLRELIQNLLKEHALLLDQCANTSAITIVSLGRGQVLAHSGRQVVITLKKK